MNNQNKSWLIGMPLVLAFALVAGLWMGSLMARRQQRSTGTEKFQEILTLLSESYVDHVNMDSLMEEFIPQFLQNFDPHTAYIPASDLEQVNADLEGSFSGVGIAFQVQNDTIMVTEVVSGGPSEKVGLMAGDRIVSINDSVVAGNGILAEKVQKLLRGKADTKVKIGVRRASSAKELTYTVTRGEVPVTSIDASYIIAPGVGYVKVNKFARNTFDEFYTELIRLGADGAADFIIDLRGNGGGFLDNAILMANEFLSPGAGIVVTRGRDGHELVSATADGTGSFASKKHQVVVLIDEFSASASEIFAGAMQDNDRGLIVGRRSFGKGLVQEQLTLNDGSAIRITTARYYTPSGRCIQKPYVKGHTSAYLEEVYDRYFGGEAFSADSVKHDDKQTFHTAHHRTVYGGGGITPDIYVASDTSAYSKYLNSVFNAGLVHQFAFEYTDANRAALDRASTSDELLALLPSDSDLLSQFVSYAARHGVPAQWYYINISRPMLINRLKAYIARDALGVAACYEVLNSDDNMVAEALRALKAGKAKWPITK
jgi:carboxyl-terminal processing protease